MGGILNDDGTFDFEDKDGFEYRLPKHWDYDNAFTFESDDLKQIFLNVSPGNTAITTEMEQFVPSEIIMKFGFYPQRLMFYVDGAQLDDFEIQKIKEYKDYCKRKGYRIPGSDPELLRYMQHNGF